MSETPEQARAREMKVAKQKGQEVFRAISRALDPFIEELDDEARDVVETRGKIVAILIGTRTWFSSFETLEARLVSLIEETSGGAFSSENYARGVAHVQEETARRADEVFRRMIREQGEGN